MSKATLKISLEQAIAERDLRKSRPHSYGSLSDRIIEEYIRTVEASMASMPEDHPMVTSVTDKVVAECMASVSDPLQWGTMPSALRDSLREFAHILAARLASTETDQQAGAPLPLAPSEAVPLEFDVRRILLDVTPGWDGMGEEVYAKSVADVEKRLGDLGERLENWELGINKLATTQPQSTPAASAEKCDDCGDAVPKVFCHYRENCGHATRPPINLATPPQATLPASEAAGYTDGGRNMFYEGRFDGETARQQKARLRWADDMRAAFERHTGNGWFDKDWHHETGIWAAAWRDATRAQPQADAAEPQPRLKVRLTCFPESNGKTNWTALLVREEKWDGLIGNCGGISLARGELWNRVAYEAEQARFLIGQRDTEPFILDYGDDIKTPEEWKGETHRAQHAAQAPSAAKKEGQP